MLPKPHPSPSTRRIAGLLALIITGLLQANPVTERFEHANLLYEQGYYDQAADAYQSILESGSTSAALHFNLGNAHFRLGQLGQAIAQFRLAQHLHPRDPDIAANLRFAQQQVAGTASVRPSLFQRQLHRLHLDEWTMLATASFWLLFSLLALRQLRPALKPRLQPWTLGASFATASLVLAVLLAWHHLRAQATAIAVEPEAEVRYGPVYESRIHFTVPDGTELRAREHLDDWVQVTDATGRTGWIRRTDIVLLP
jgi:tetratricopeptide (TPR) repeat protein